MSSDQKYQEPIAIIGMACRLPGADGLEPFWDLLSQGKSAVSELPSGFMDRTLYYDERQGVPGKSYSVLGGLVEPRPIDTELCPLAQDDLQDGDPCHLSLCEVAAAACRHAGYDPRLLHATFPRTGIYIGHSGGSNRGSDQMFATMVPETLDFLTDVPEFQNLNIDTQRRVLQEATEHLQSGKPLRNTRGEPILSADAAASMIARTLKLDGPHLVIDAACSSSLMALALGAHGLRQGDIDLAIVGGASYSKPESLILFSQARSCSATGSRPFDDAADGLISSEGYVVFLLKRLSQAKADGDTIQAVVSGVGLSSDGRGRSLWAPRKEGQVEALRRAYGSGIDPSTVDFIEAHATSTQVGDATELEALAEFFGSGRGSRRIPIGSIKSNIGHTLETAGAAGLLKAILAIQNNLVPPTINVQIPNRTVPWETVPFEIASQPRPLPPHPGRQPRRAAVNAFGIGGLNVHVIVDEYVPDEVQEYSSPQSGPGQTGAKCCDAPEPTREEPIAIIGRGVILPGVQSIDDLETMLSQGETRIVEAPDVRWRRHIGVEPGGPVPRKAPHCRGGYITDYQFDWARHRIPPKQIAHANPMQYMLLDASKQALHEAGLTDDPAGTPGRAARANTAVVVGSMFSSDFSNQLLMGLRLPEILQAIQLALGAHRIEPEKAAVILDDFRNRLLDSRPALLDETGSFTSSTLASRITKELDLMGGAMAIDAGDCSSSAALQVAINLLRVGACSQVLCAGAQRTMDLAGFEPLALQSRLRGSNEADPEQGFEPGEGVAAVLLKPLSRAKQDGNPILGLIHHVERIPDAMSCQSRPRSGLHAAPLMSRIGNLLAAQGLVSLLQATLTPASARVTVLDDQAVDGQAYAITFDHPDTVDLATQNRSPMASVLDQTQGLAPLPRALSNISQTEPHIYRFAGTDTQSLKDTLQTAQQDLAGYLKHGVRPHFGQADALRVAIVADSISSLSEKLLLAMEHWQQPSALGLLHAKGIFVGRGPAPGRRIAFVFPGQGSQYAGMLTGLLAVSESARLTRDAADAILAKLGSPPFADLMDNTDDALHEDIWRTQISVLLADIFMFQALTELGIRADCVCGHSFGEIPALFAAGALSLEQAILITRHRADAIANLARENAQDASPDRHGLLSVQTGQEPARLQVARFNAALDGSPDDCLHITHFNAPNQTVVGGRMDSLQSFESQLAGHGIQSELLNVPHAFHTPYMQDARDAFAEMLSGIDIQPPGTLVLSGVGNRYVADPDSIRRRLPGQLTEPVEYLQMVRRLVDDGFSLLVEVGPQRVLTGLNRQIFPGQEALCLATDNRRCSSSGEAAQAQLLMVQAALECERDWQSSSALANLSARMSIGYAPAGAPPAPGRISRFDATAKRRDRLRRLASDHVYAPPSRRGEPSAGQPGGDGSSQDVNARQDDALLAYLIDFIVEQTGYPPEIIDIEWEFEADLGIDSIKKAQLFGHLRETFDLEPMAAKFMVAGKLSLNAFRTLRDVLDLLRQCESRHPLPAPADNGPPCHGTSALRGTGLQAPPQASASGTSHPPAPSNHLENLLIDFAVEQTGYPREIIELDADFEADLGIDSIKKAQLLGEVREQFSLNIEPFNGMDRTLFSRIRTLRDMLDFLRTLPEFASMGPSSAVLPPTTATPANAIPPQRPHTDTQRNPDPESARAYARGLTRGKKDAEIIRNVLVTAMSLPATARPPIPQDALSHFSQVQISEMQGMAEGAGVHVGNIVAFNLAGLSAQGPRTPEQACVYVQDCVNTPEPHGESQPITESLSSHLSPLTPGASSDRQATVTHRYLLRTVPAPQPLGSPPVPELNGAAVILGDNPVARALQARIRNLGREAYCIAPVADATRTVAELESIWRIQPAPHLFITTPRDSDAASTHDWQHWRRRRKVGIATPFWFCQKWLQLVQQNGLMDDASLMAAVSSGGDLGFTSSPHAIEGGGIAGLVKAILIESWVNGHRTTPIKVVDAPPDEAAEAIAEAMVRELATPDYDTETTWQGTFRSKVQARISPLPRHTPTPAPSVKPGGHWLCTGGARGITAFVAQELAKRYGLTLSLIGTSPHPTIPPDWRDMTDDQVKALKLSVMTSARAAGDNPVKAWEQTEKAIEIEHNLRHMQASGIRVNYYPCDVSDITQLAGVLEHIREVSGPINAVLHGAGTGKDSRFEHKDPKKVEQCIHAKVDGAMAIMALTREDPLQYFIAFSSISGRFGANGHTDYSLANEMMAKTIGWYRHQRPEVASTAFHWHAWGDIGMATKPETRLALEMIDMDFMPAREGLDHLIDELEAGLPEAEVLITDDRYYRLFFPAESLTQNEDTDQQATYPLLARGDSFDQAGLSVCSVPLHPLLDPFLREHRQNDRPILPMVIGLEMLAEAGARVSAPAKYLELSQVEALNGLRFFSDETQTVRIHARPMQQHTNGTCDVDCLLVADFLSRSGQRVESDRPYLRGTVHTAHQPRIRNRSKPRVPPGPWRAIEYAPPGGAFYHGPSLQRLRKIKVDGNRAWGRISAPAVVELAGPRQSVTGWRLPSAALDACLYATGTLAWVSIRPGVSLPAGFGRLIMGRMPYPGEPCLVEIALKDCEGRHACFDFTLYGNDGGVILEAEDYRIVWLAE